MHLNILRKTFFQSRIGSTIILIFFLEIKTKYVLDVLKNKKINYYLDYNKIKKKDFNNYTLARKLIKDYVVKQSNGLIRNIEFIDHHTCHAFYAAYAPNIKENKSAVLTIDSEGR